MIIGIAFIWIAFFHLTPIADWLNFKPFNCIVCLSFWSVLIASIIIHFYPQFEFVFNGLGLAGIGAYSAIIFKRLIYRI
jgi:hypothetical protein